MSTVTTLSHPTSSSLTVPATQNTAPVFSFSCLYTHDLRRKQKRWQDGMLRFHTFNKRIMVYDIPRNFIGDTFWRESQALQDGDDLELEKGVLVQVGEQVEKTMTDLSGLLEKRTPKQPVEEDPRDSQVGQGSYQTVARSQASGTMRPAAKRRFETPLAHLRPKSLNALLGRPRGPVGRAAMPTRSPAELRSEKENGSIGASSMPSTNTKPRVNEGTRSASSGQDLVEPGRLAIAVKRPNNRRRQHEESLNYDQSSTESLLQNDVESSRTSTSDCANPQSKTLSLMRQTNVEDAQSKQKRNSKSSRTKERSSEHTPRDRGPAKKTAIEDTELKEVSFEDEPRPENMLRIASKKPRKKLMYRDLLPQSAQRSHDPPPLNAQNRKGNGNQPNASNGTLKTPPEDSLEEFHQGQQDRLHSRFRKRTSPTSDIHDQPLPPNANPNTHRNKTGKPPALPHDDPDLNIPDSLFLTPQSPPHAPPSDPIPTSTQAARALTEIDARLLRRPSKPTTATTTIKAALPPNNQQRPPHHHRLLQRSTSALAMSSLPKKPPTITTTKKPLRKALSDTLLLPSHPAAPAATTTTTTTKPTKPSTLYRSSSSSSASAANTAQAQPADPWSSKEAWDLFGFLEGGDKRITTSNGVPSRGREKGEMEEGGMEDLMVESQGFV
ncbi:MAG: hypothetical protein LQ345_003715 [Seirophora villosa]|nr:MAG: hypothetical protein LQ345_003715 [Seirophora villosa]